MKTRKKLDNRGDEFYAQKKKTFYDESALLSDPDFARQGECLERRERKLRSGDSEQLWNVPLSQSSLENSESQRYAEPRFWIAAQHTEFDGHFRFFFFKIYLLENGTIVTRNGHETWRRIETRTAKFNNTDSSIYQES